ncbi:MAG: hypothetical protein RR490_00425 [Niameybacter sp.]
MTEEFKTTQNELDETLDKNIPQSTTKRSESEDMLKTLMGMLFGSADE